MALPTEGFLLEYAPGRLVVGAGPLEARPSRQAADLACYAPDFLLRHTDPWLHPTTWHETTREGLRDMLHPASLPGIAWTDPDPDDYAERFAAILRAIHAGTLSKAVPVILERGTWDAPPPRTVDTLVARALATSGSAAVYAVWTPSGSMVGASPEILFRWASRGRLDTVAMAGTYPIARAAGLGADPKEAREHASVVDDIVAALSPLGTVTVGSREVIRLPTMAHLQTAIALAPTEPLDFMPMVRALHPTAALGVAPRVAGPEALPSLGPVDRGRFGAPFGVEWPDGRAHVLVAIRNVQWAGTSVVIGAGAGLIAESRLEREWDELRLKRSAVKEMLGL